MSIGAPSSMVTNHDSYIIEVRKTPQYGTLDSYIEGSRTSYDAPRYRHGTSSST